MDDNNSKADDAETRNATLPRYKVTKRPAAIYGQPNGQGFGFDSEWVGGVFGQTHLSLW